MLDYIEFALSLLCFGLMGGITFVVFYLAFFEGKNKK